MGRHSSPDQGHFYRSFMGWLSLWLMIAAVTAVGVWYAVTAIGGPDVRRSVAAETARHRTTDDSAAPQPTVSGARIANEVPDAATADRDEPAQGTRADTKLVTDGITVQVLNGTLEDAAAQSLADKLGGFGYGVVAVEESSRLYSETTVFWSTAAAREAALALAERFGWIAERKPANLSSDVSLHVVVGADEA